MRVQRAAAGLRRRRVDLAAVGQQHVRRVAVDVGEDEILDAAREQGDAVARLGRAAASLRAISAIRERRRHPRRLRLEPPQASRGSSRVRPERADERLQAAALIEPQQRARARAARRGRMKRNRSVSARQKSRAARVVDARPLDVARAPSRRARRSSRRPGTPSGRRGSRGSSSSRRRTSCVDLELAVGDRAHERDAAARAVALALGRVVGRAGRQAHAAVHALLQHRVVERLAGVACDMAQSKILPGFSRPFGSSARLTCRISSKLRRPSAGAATASSPGRRRARR